MDVESDSASSAIAGRPTRKASSRLARSFRIIGEEVKLVDIDKLPGLKDQTHITVNKYQLYS